MYRWIGLAGQCNQLQGGQAGVLNSMIEQGSTPPQPLLPRRNTITEVSGLPMDESKPQQGIILPEDYHGFATARVERRRLGIRFQTHEYESRYLES